VALWDAERLRVSCCCFLMCGMGAAANGIIGVVVSDRVACASRICAAASREAPLVAARCRLALAMGLVSRLSEHSVLAECPLDCISIIMWHVLLHEVGDTVSGCKIYGAQWCIER